MSGVEQRLSFALKQIDALHAFRTEISSLAIKHQKLTAELLLVRLAIAVENCLSSTCYRIVSGQPLLSGRKPSLLHGASAIAQAERVMKQGVSRLIWLDASDVARALKKGIASTDSLINNVQRHGQTLADIRKIRNHVAHHNRTSSTAFQQVVRRVYGANLNAITPGTLLLTTRAGTTPLIDVLNRSARISLREILEA